MTDSPFLEEVPNDICFSEQACGPAVGFPPIFFKFIEVVMTKDNADSSN